MTTPFIILSLLLANPTPEQVELLKTFRNEFVAVTPRGEELKPYAIAKYEVPQNLWQAVVGNNPSRWKGKRNSVEMVSLDEARKFCRQATDLMRASALIRREQVIRLPTDGEWEY